MKNPFFKSHYYKDNLFLLFLFSIFYVAADFPKFYIISFIISVLTSYTFFLFIKKNIITKNIFQYYLPLFFLLLYYNEQIFNNNLDYKLYANNVWSYCVFYLITLLLINHEKLDQNINLIINTVKFGLLLSLLIIFFFNFFFFEYPITRSGFIHPFTKLDIGYLIFNLDFLKNIKPINIRSVYEILELIFVLSLFSIYKKNKVKINIILIVFILIIGCTFGSRLFVIFIFLSLIFYRIFFDKKFFGNSSILLIIFFIIMLFNISIYSFISKETYVQFFYNKDFNKKINLSYAQNLNNNKKDFKDILKKERIVFLQDEYYVIIKNDENYKKKIIDDEINDFSLDESYKYKIKKDYIEYEYFNKNNIKVKKINYKNSFVYVPGVTFRTSQERFIKKKDVISLKNRPKLLALGILDKDSDDSKEFIQNIHPSGHIIYHNLILDSFHTKAYLASLLLIFIYMIYIKFLFLLFKFRFTNKKIESFGLLIILNYFIYDQLLQTSILTGNKSIFLFSIFFALVLKKNKKILY